MHIDTYNVMNLELRTTVQNIQISQTPMLRRLTISARTPFESQHPSTFSCPTGTSFPWDHPSTRQQSQRGTLHCEPARGCEQ